MNLHRRIMMRPQIKHTWECFILQCSLSYLRMISLVAYKTIDNYDWKWYEISFFFTTTNKIIICKFKYVIKLLFSIAFFLSFDSWYNFTPYNCNCCISLWFPFQVNLKTWPFLMFACNITLLSIQSRNKWNGK